MLTKNILNRNLLIITKLITLLCIPKLSMAINYNFDSYYYGGVDFGIQKFKFEPGYGDNLFPKNLPKVNFFAGLKLNEYLGAELGYDTTIYKKKDAVLYAGDQYLGVPVTAGLLGPIVRLDYISTIKNSVKSSGVTFKITGNYPLNFNFLKNPINLIMQIGMKNNRMKISSNLSNMKIFVGPNVAPLNETTTLKKTKNILILSVGLQYLLNENVGIRILGNWEQLSKFKMTEYSLQGSTAINHLLQAKLKNSIGYSLGIIFTV